MPHFMGINQLVYFCTAIACKCISYTGLVFSGLHVLKWTCTLEQFKSLQHYANTNTGRPSHLQRCVQIPSSCKCNLQQHSLEGHFSHLLWIPSHRDLVYLSVETQQHHNRKTANQGIQWEVALSCYFVLVSSLQCPAVRSTLWRMDEDWLREQNELLTVFRGAETYHPTNGEIIPASFI